MHRTLLACAALLACCLPLLAGAGDSARSGESSNAPKTLQGLPLVFEDDFENGMERWTPTDPKAWKIAEEEGNHVLSLHASSDYKPPVRSPHSIARVADLNVTDFLLEMKMKQTGREYGHRDLCLFFGYQDPSHFYYVHLATKADAHANSIFLVNDEPRVSIAQERTDGTDWATGYHHVRIVREAESGLIEVYFDDMEKPVMRTVDKTFTWGSVGVGSFDDTGNIDDVRIWGRVTERQARDDLGAPIDGIPRVESGTVETRLP